MSDIEKAEPELKFPAEELTDKINTQSFNLSEVNRDIESIEKNQNEALQEYDGFPDTITVLGEEMDISSILRDDLLANRVVSLFEDIPEAKAAMDSFLGMEEGRDELASKALNIENKIINLEQEKYMLEPNPSQGMSI